MEGSELLLICEAVGVPRPLITWSKDGKVLQKRTNDTNFVREYAKEDHNGNYECKASNFAGSDSYRIDVIIKGNSLKRQHTVSSLIIYHVILSILHSTYRKEMITKGKCLHD